MGVALSVFRSVCILLPQFGGHFRCWCPICRCAMSGAARDYRYVLVLPVHFGCLYGWCRLGVFGRYGCWCQKFCLVCMRSSATVWWFVWVLGSYFGGLYGWCCQTLLVGFSVSATAFRSVWELPVSLEVCLGAGATFY